MFSILDLLTISAIQSKKIAFPTSEISHRIMEPEGVIEPLNPRLSAGVFRVPKIT